MSCRSKPGRWKLNPIAGTCFPANMFCWRFDHMKSRILILLGCCVLLIGLAPVAFSQRPSAQQSELSTVQRLEVMTQKLDQMKRSLTSAISAMPADKSKDKKQNADDPAVRLRSLEKEVSSLISEVADIRTKNERAEKFDPTAIERLEASVAELNPRVDAGLQQTASARTGAAAAS